MNPPDFHLSPVSRTIGVDRIVDEFILHFTHTTEVDWMLPGIAPTDREVSVPTVAIVEFKDGKLAHEHIYRDQASVLVKIGKLDQRDLPVVGAEAALKVVDTTVPSNTLMRSVWQRSKNMPI